jgi:transglutaminase-like putative cysteine protease
MYDIRQFKPALYTLLILGFSGFALATQTTGMWVLATAMLLLNIWLIRTGRFSPMPRWMANIVTIGAVVYIVSEIRANTAVPIVLIGQFLVLLQLVKVYEQRANRDYAQLLVLSLLLVVAAAINTASLIFGAILIIYLFLSLYCCLLFHLKVETDHAKVALGVREDRINPATFRQDQRYLSSSMRRLTFLVSMVAIALAVGVFLFFPRGAGANWLTPLQMRATASVGFSDEVSFQNIARIQQNNELAARVRVLHNGKPVQGTMMLLLRGNVHTDYSGGTGSWKWSRSTQPEPPQIDINPGGGSVQLPGRQSDDLWYQEITLEPHGLSTLFSMPGPVAVGGSNDLTRLRFFPRDDVIATIENVSSQLKYTVISSNATYTPGPTDAVINDARSRQVYDWRWLLNTLQAPTSARSQRPVADAIPRPGSHSIIDPKIAEMARRPEVSGADANGPLVAQRDSRVRRPLAVDEEIASNIEKYLRTNYSYTLDLTDARSILEGGQDPMVSFLYDVKRGHCEYFAGAMTLMCQSLGMNARLVVGFKCDEYNAAGGYYMVRQSHAHAWVEVLTPKGWRSFDPTSSNEAGASAASSAWAKAKHYFDYLEFLWATTVIAYDRDSRDNMLQNIRNLDVKMTNTLINSRVDPRDMKRSMSDWLGKIFTETNFLLFSSRILSGLIYLMFFALAGAIGGFIYERVKLRKRAKRIGLESLPQQDLVRLARQLGFYDELLRLLARHRIERSRSQTPREFAESLAYLPAQAYDLVHRLTDLYYQIRYGGVELNAARRSKVHKAIGEVEGIMRDSARRSY